MPTTLLITHYIPPDFQTLRRSWCKDYKNITLWSTFGDKTSMSSWNPFLEGLWVKGWRLKKVRKKKSDVIYGWPHANRAKSTSLLGESQQVFDVSQWSTLVCFFWREYSIQNHMPILKTGQWVTKEWSAHCVFWQYRHSSLLISIGKLKPTIGMITYRNTCALDSKGKITYKLI